MLRCYTRNNTVSGTLFVAYGTLLTETFSTFQEHVPTNRWAIYHTANQHATYMSYEYRPFIYTLVATSSVRASVGIRTLLSSRSFVVPGKYQLPRTLPTARVALDPERDRRGARLTLLLLLVAGGEVL